jgi:hypothetical protein
MDEEESAQITAQQSHELGQVGISHPQCADSSTIEKVI